MLLGRQPFVKKPYFYSVFFEKQCQKKPKSFGPRCQKRFFFARCWITSQSSLIGPQNTKQKNTNRHQNLSQKSSKKPIFVVRKWAPQEVVLSLTLEVVPKLTLERPKSGTKTNSPAYIYIYLSRLPATGLKKPKSPKVPGRVLGSPGKKRIAGRLSMRETEKPHCSQQSPQQRPFSWNSSQHSPRHFWGFGLSQSCSRWPRFQL